MKTYLVGLIFISFLGLTLETNAQNIKTTFKKSTINWDEDIAIDSDLVIQDATIENARKIIISGSKIEVVNSSMKCSELEISCADISLKNGTITCDKLTFKPSVKRLNLGGSVRIVCKHIEFESSTSTSTALTVKNTSAGEFLVKYSDRFIKGNRILEFVDLGEFLLAFKKM